MSQAQRDALEAGLVSLNLKLGAEIQDRLINYLALLQKWNRVFNLTAVRDPVVQVERHLLDSLACRPFIQHDRCCDVGSGAGLPGIPLAISSPGQSWSLLDSNGKKTRFLAQCAIELGLNNIEVVQARCDHWFPEARYDCVVSRAFTSLRDFATGCRHLVREGGSLLALKGCYPAEEIREIPEGFHVLECRPIKLPGSSAERHLVQLSTG